MRWRLPVLLTAATAVVVSLALLGPAGPAVRCLPAACDCELVGAGPIRQPGNAWSSLALAIAGIGLALRPTRHPLDSVLAGVVTSAGLAAFWYHASLAEWGARLDGTFVAAVLGVLAAREWSDRLLPGVAALAAGAVAAGAWAGTAALNAVTAVLAGAAGAGIVRTRRRRSRDVRLLSASAALLAAGAAAWWFGRSGEPGCAPEAPLGLHGLWHLLAAAAIAAGAAYLHSGAPPQSPPSDLPS